MREAVVSNVIHLQTRQRVDPVDDCEPVSGECLACFVHRMVRRRACTGTLVWAEQWKRRRSPGASALIGRLERQGGVCDCALSSVLWVPASELRGGIVPGEPAEPGSVTPCAGVRPRSTRPCRLWSAAATAR